MILILSEPDAHSDAIVEELNRRGVASYVVANSQFPEAGLSMRLTAGLEAARITVDGTSIDLRTVEAIWFRRPNKAKPAAGLTDPVGREFVAAETDAVCDDLWDTLGVRSFPAPRHIYWRASRRALQLRTATQVGFEIPATLVTNDPDELMDFARPGWAMISKQAAITPPANRDGKHYLRFTEPLRSVDLLNVEALRLCPVMVQAEVAKRLELRVTVVGNRVFTAAIDSQRSNRARRDWRRYDHQHASTTRCDLPAEVEDRCLRLTRALGLGYGAIDLILTPDGRFVFLEINPNGQFLWIEHLSGLPITAAIADVLCETETRTRTAT